VDYPVHMVNSGMARLKSVLRVLASVRRYIIFISRIDSVSFLPRVMVGLPSTSAHQDNEFLNYNNVDSFTLFAESAIPRGQEASDRRGLGEMLSSVMQGMFVALIVMVREGSAEAGGPRAHDWNLRPLVHFGVRCWNTPAYKERRERVTATADEFKSGESRDPSKA
jgi:hypothetical protein